MNNVNVQLTPDEISLILNSIFYTISGKSTKDSFFTKELVKLYDKLSEETEGAIK